MNYDHVRCVRIYSNIDREMCTTLGITHREYIIQNLKVCNTIIGVRKNLINTKSYMIDYTVRLKRRPRNISHQYKAEQQKMGQSIVPRYEDECRYKK